MKCPNCGSENVSYQIVTKSKLKDKHHSIIWWLLIGWWWVPTWWICFTVPALIIKATTHKKQKIKQKNLSMCVCQHRGYKWAAK